MRRSIAPGALLLASFMALSLGLLLPAAGSADPSSELRRNADRLRQENATLEQRSESVVVGLYALDSRLSAARDRLSALQARSASVRAQQASALKRLAIVRRVLAVSQRHLQERIVVLYEQGETDPLAVFLGSESLSEAVTSLDHIGSLATQDQHMIRQARSSRTSLRALTRTLTARAERLEQLERQAADATAAIESARAERVRFISQLASERRLNRTQIASLEDRAAAAEARADEVAAQRAVAPAPAPAEPVPSPAPPSPSSPGGTSMTVVATAYALPGTTATGLPVGPGIVAVDPTVIPFGTRMTIPGYGEGVAADTGSAIKGARIDVWVPTEAQAVQWGIKTITITIH